MFAVDVLRFPGCGGGHTILAAITQAEVIRAILAAPHLPTESPAVPTPAARSLINFRARRSFGRGKEDSDE